jgi:hypothetical protein
LRGPIGKIKLRKPRTEFVISRKNAKLIADVRMSLLALPGEEDVDLRL